MRTPRKAAKDVKVGDWILTCYRPRTWAAVTQVAHYLNGDEKVMLDTPTDRTWYPPDALVACRRRPV